MIDINVTLIPPPQSRQSSNASRSGTASGYVYRFETDDYVYLIPAPISPNRLGENVRQLPRNPSSHGPLPQPAADNALTRFLGWLGAWMDGRSG